MSDKIHRPKKNDTFTLGLGPNAMTCDVDKVSKDCVHYTVRSNGERRFFFLDSLTHELAQWMPNKLLKK